MDPISEAITNLSKRIRKLESRSHIIGLDYICFQDQKSSGVDGGSSSSGVWTKRDLNTVVANENDHAILNMINGKFYLDAGTYYCLIKCPAHRCDEHMARLYDSLHSSVILLGSSEFSSMLSSYATTSSFIVGSFSLSEKTELEVDHYCGYSRATDGFGKAVGAPVNEIYTVVELWRRYAT